MNMGQAIDRFIENKWSYGHFTSKKTENSYRLVLARHLEDVFNDDPTMTDRDDVMKTLERYARPNTKGHARSVLVSFYTWLEENGYRKDNPARQTPKPKKQEVSSYRFTLDEVQRLLAACMDERERRVVHIGLCAGLRNAELRGLQGRHFQRHGWIWVSKDIAKGSRERFVPVIDELLPLWERVNASVGLDEWVLPSTYRRSAVKPLSSATIGRIVKDVAVRAGIDARVYPHLMRHGFATQIARQAGPLAAQSMLGHKDIGTTQIYMSKPTLEDLTLSVAGVRLAPVVEAEVSSAQLPAGTAHNVENSETVQAMAFGRSLVAIGDFLRPVARRLGSDFYGGDWGAA